MVISKNEIKFLGMHLKNGVYYLSEHVAKELLFLDESHPHKQVEQFLSTVNYLGDFVANISNSMQPLQKMLKKDSPP